MNEKKKIIIVIVVALLLFSIIPIAIYSNVQKQKEEMKKFHESLTSETPKAIYIGRTGCTYCQMFAPILEQLSEKYKFEYNYINTDIISNKQLNEILSKSDIIPEDFGTPTTIVVQNGKVIAKNVGFMPEDDLFNLLKDNGVIATDAKLSLNYLTYSDYESVLKSSKKGIVVIGQSTCGYCLQAHPELVKIADNYNVKINYLNISKLSTTDSEKFTNSLPYLNEENWGTPLMMVVQNNKLIDTFSGAGSFDDYVSFLKKNGFIEE